MKKRTIIPAVIAMGFFAGCDWSSWCSCSKKTNEPTKKIAHAKQHESAPAEHAVKQPISKSQPETEMTPHAPMPEDDDEMQAPKAAPAHIAAEPEEDAE